MAPGLKIEINENEFMRKTIKEQNLDLYKMICYMNSNGCEWAKKRTNKMYVVSAAAGSVFGFLAGLGKAIIEK